MPLPARLFPGDEELGKRDDDHRPGGKKNPLGLVWQHKRISAAQGLHRRTLKRLLLGLLGLVAVYYFFKNMPTDVENHSHRPQYIPNTGKTGTQPPPESPPQSQTPGAKPAEKSVAPLHDFNGPIKFYELAATLHSVFSTSGSDLINPNVVCTLNSQRRVSAKFL
jgi:hypothetical protein